MFEKITSKLADAGLADGSKTYTPFTLLCTVFFIYYNLEGLTYLFAGEDTEEVMTGVRLLTQGRSGWEWASHSVEILLSALAVMTVYSFWQVAASGIWSLTTVLNVWLNQVIRSNQYRSATEFIALDAENNQLVTRLEEKDRKIRELVDTAEKDANEIKNLQEQIVLNDSKHVQEIGSLQTTLEEKTNQVKSAKSGLESQVQESETLSEILIGSFRQKSLIDKKLQMKALKEYLESEPRRIMVNKLIENLPMKNRYFQENERLSGKYIMISHVLNDMLDGSIDVISDLNELGLARFWWGEQDSTERKRIDFIISDENLKILKEGLLATSTEEVE